MTMVSSMSSSMNALDAAPRAGAGWRPMLPWLCGVLVTAVLVAVAPQLNGYHAFVLAQVALLALVGIGLNVLIGLSGQMSFGHVGFYAIGAYAVAVLTTAQGWSFWPAWAVGAALSAVLGALLALPALRVKGPYLAMITIAFGFVVEHSAVELRGLTGGQNGLMGIMGPAFGEVRGERAMAIIAVVAAAVALAAYALLSRGSWGLALRAARDSEVAAESIGLQPLALKTVAFAVSAALAGLAGGLYAPLSGFVTPQSFGFSQSLLFVLVVVIGGSGTVAGPIIGALVVGLLPEMLSGLEEYRLLFFGALLLVVLWAAPQGLVGLMRAVAGWVMTHVMRRVGPAVPSTATHQSATNTTAKDTAPLLATRARKVLKAEALGKVFGGVRAVDGVGFEVQPAAVTSLIGPNGAGKSTVLNLLSGFYKPDAGRRLLGGQVMPSGAAWRSARGGIARTYQTSLLFGSLSVLDNVALALPRGRLGALLGRQAVGSPAAQAKAVALLRWCGYLGDVHLPAAGLPHVDRRLVEIARALAADPDQLLLDEPAAGLSRQDKQQLATLLRRVADAGLGVLVVEHDMTLVMDISDHVVVIDAGKPLAEGTPAAVQQDAAVRRAYLGEPGALQATRRAAGVADDARELLGVGRLTTGYGAAPVLHAVDIQVREGEMIALLGANGAGKSTLMRSLCGLHRPLQQGGIHLDGQDLALLRAEQIVGRGLVLVPEGRQVFPELSVLDNLRLGAFTCPDGREARVEQMLQRFPRLRERLHQRAGLLSGGEQQMLAIGRALMARPRVLLLDEPSLGLAPQVIAELFAALDALRAESMTLVLVDQMAPLALALADRAYVIEDGRIVASGDAASIAADPALAQAYLGGH
jgi:ABC-type branched-subunit amino acid transport system ATPase component/ABC-type branched-subunit amino acid transport system permease subunit